MKVKTIEQLKETNKVLLHACEEALCQLHGNLGDLTDHFEIKHTKEAIDTLEEAIKQAK